MKEVNSFKKGIISGIPICMGYFSVSFAFGIFSVQNGLTVIEAFLISMTNLTSAGQLAGVPIIAAGGSLIEIVVTQLVINSRYALMSISLSQKLGKSVSLLDRFLISFANTDEVFAVASSSALNVGRKYMFGLIIPPVSGWCSGTLLGALAGDVLPTLVSSSLGIAIYGMFIAIVVPAAKKESPIMLCVLISIILSLIFFYVPFLKNSIPSGFVIIICALISSAVMARFAPVEIEVDEND